MTKMQFSIQRFIEDALKNPDTNYFEFRVLAQGNTGDIMYHTGLTKALFYTYLHKMTNTSFKYYQRQYKETTVGNTYYQNNNNEDSSIFTVNTTSCASGDDKFLAVSECRKKISILGLSSTRDIYKESYVKRMTFRITNRVFINFDNGIDTDTPHYNITVNYNHDKDVDVGTAVNAIEKSLVTLFQE
jgi:hypothetical protein